MKKINLLLFVFILIGMLGATSAKNYDAKVAGKCMTCHKEKSPGIYKQWQKSKHAQHNVTCLTCHAAESGDKDAFNTMEMTTAMSGAGLSSAMVGAATGSTITNNSTITIEADGSLTGPTFNLKIKSGETLTEENLIVKRPGHGISPIHWDEIIGRKIQKKIKNDELLTWENLL